VPVVRPWRRDRGARRPAGAGSGVAARSGLTGHATASGPLDDPAFRAGLRPTDTHPTSVRPASDLAGVAPDGRSVGVVLGDARTRWWLLAFVGPGCYGCRAFFAGVAAPGRGGLPVGVGVVAVTRLPLPVSEQVSLAQAEPGPGPLLAVASEQAWADYRVGGYPFYVVVDAARRVVAAETVGLGWEDVVGAVRSAIAAAVDPADGAS
jgi:hypothetical protein